MTDQTVPRPRRGTAPPDDGLRTSPPRVRDDVASTPPPPTVAPAPTRGRVRAAGVTLALGTLAWAGSIPLVGPAAGQVTVFVCLLFQVGLWALLAVMWRTWATGTPRAARGLLVVEAVLLGLATVSSVVALSSETIAATTPFAIFDMAWPLSMLGMAVIGVKIAITGRWRGVLRWWPLVAESWVLVVLPLSALGETVSAWACGLHLLVGYTTLGVLLLLRPDLVLDRE